MMPRVRGRCPCCPAGQSISPAPGALNGTGRRMRAPQVLHLTVPSTEAGGRGDSPRGCPEGRCALARRSGAALLKGDAGGGVPPRFA
ncbi:hypothetical protein EVK84_06360 [Edwardsiella piscicida]|nr:hypothetical protein EVK84_06360 [Edwardsiella piscicida]